MKKLKSLFDYLFYRIYTFFREKGDNVPETKGTLILSLIQFFTLLDILVLIRLVYPFSLPHKYYVLPLIILIGFMNWYKYEKNLDLENFEEKWKDEDPERKVRDEWLIGGYLILSFLIPALHGILEHNLKVL
ncbi:hypothetical protein [Fulvivirga imtechensis]|nr:hypothetical protein [Fulvivirga imtechensis]